MPEDESLALMPVAAILAMSSLLLLSSFLSGLYARVTFKRVSGSVQSSPLPIIKLLIRLTLAVLCVLAYAYTVAQIESQTAPLFEPYEILDIQRGANATVVKKAYKKLSLKHHPDKGGDSDAFQLVAAAYKALSDPTSMSNYDQYGHPDGPQTATLSFAAPEWLLKPTGATAAVLVLMYLGLFVAICVYVYRYYTGAATMAEAKAQSNSVARLDMQHLAMGLNKNTAPMDLLWWLATTPENILEAKKRIEQVEVLKKQRKGDKGLDLSEGAGWANEDPNETPQQASVRKTREEMERKKIAAMAGAANSASLSTEKIEGVDEGVIGIKWVEDVLVEIGAWPPKIPCLTPGSPSYVGALPKAPDGSVVAVLNSPPVRRNMVMIVARINAIKLNTRPELRAAAEKGLIDGGYFQESMRFRMKISMMFEACLRVATMQKSATLAHTVISTVSMFKIGVNSAKHQKNIDWFKKTIVAQYGSPKGLPSMKLNGAKVETEGCDEIACNDTCTLTVDLTRTHAKTFTDKKVEVCEKQGLNTQEQLAKYRESWWVLLSIKNKAVKPKATGRNAAVNKLVADHEAGKGQDLILAYPVMVMKIDKERTTVALKFRAPAAPGKYTLALDVMSTDFIGCDSESELSVEIVDESSVKPVEVDYGLDDEKGADDGDDGDDSNDDDDDDDEDGDVVIVSSPKSASSKKNE